MIYYTADLHFGHSNVIKMDNRPFSDVEEMNAELIRRWNAKVKATDTVYIVGDFHFLGPVAPEYFLEALAGHKILVIGNHDNKMLKRPEILRYFDDVGWMMFIHDEGRDVCLSHFPQAEWNGFYRGWWHVYGHIHSNLGETAKFMHTRPRALNAGCMINNYEPVSFDELIRNNERFIAESKERGYERGGVE